MELKQWVDLILKDLIRKMQDELEKQGHVMTGALKDGLKYLTLELGTELRGYIYAAHYAPFVDKGARFINIPSTGYIEGLMRFWKKREGLSDKEAKRAAFATAKIHRVQGMPTHNARSFGAGRTGFVTNTLLRNEEAIFKTLQLAMVKVYGDEIKKRFEKGETLIRLKLT